MPSTFGTVGLGLAVLALTSCFSPEYGKQPFTCPNGACPSGYACHAGVCVDSISDAGQVDRSLAPEAGVADLLQPDDWSLPISIVRLIEATGDSVQCEEEEVAIGGGVVCKSAILSSYAMKGGIWRGACQSARPVSVWAYCVPKALLTGFSTPIDKNEGIAEATCPFGDIAVGGGCQCDNRMIATMPIPSGWHCGCRESATAIAHCINGAAAITKQMNVQINSAEGNSPIVQSLCSEGLAIGGGCSPSGEGFYRLGAGTDFFECGAIPGPDLQQGHVLCASTGPLSDPAMN